MGVFDTFYTNSLTCPVCGHAIRDIQTKEVSYFSFYEYTPFSLIRDADAVDKTAIIEDDAFCNVCSIKGKKAFFPVYIAIKNGVYLDVFRTIREAKKAMKDFSHNKMIDVAKKALKERDETAQILNTLIGDLSNYTDYLSKYPVRFIIDTDNFDRYSFNVYEGILNVRERYSPNVVKTLRGIIEKARDNNNIR